MMKDSSKKDPDRRHFLKNSLGIFIAASCCGGVTLEELRAQAQRKPLLTTRSFNERIPSPQRRESFRTEIEQIKADFAKYVNTYFDLTPGQLENFKKIPRADIREFNAALDKAIEQKLRIRVTTKMTTESCGDGTGFRLKMIFDPHVLTIISYR